MEFSRVNDPSLLLWPDVTPTQGIKNPATPRTPPGLCRHLQYICCLNLGVPTIKRTPVPKQKQHRQMQHPSSLLCTKEGSGLYFPSKFSIIFPSPPLLPCLLTPIIINRENGTHLSPSPQCPKYIWTLANRSSNSTDTQRCLECAFTSAS